MRLLYYFALILSLGGLLVECTPLKLSNKDAELFLSRHRRQTPTTKTKQTVKTIRSNKRKEKTTQQSNQQELSRFEPIPRAPSRQATEIQQRSRGGEFRQVSIPSAKGNIGRLAQQSNRQELSRLEPIPRAPSRQAAEIQQRSRGGEFRPVFIPGANGSGRLALAYFPNSNPTGGRIGESELSGRQASRTPVMIMNLDSGSSNRSRRRRPARPLSPLSAFSTFGFMPWAFAFAAARN